jgi:ferric-dicitrate binding protein FerR (iron transport regulator)
MPPTRLDALLDAYFDGTLSPDDKRELEQGLLDSAENRSRFWQWAEWDALMNEWGEETGSRETGELDPTVCDEPVRRRHRLLATSLLGPMAFGLVGFMVVALVAWFSPPSSQSQGPKMATLVSTINARWSDSATELSLITGEDPTGRLLRLMEGTAEFRTLHGAYVRVEGPAAMRFDGATAIYVESGKVVCRCPTPESRLVVNTDQTRVVDLGTEFTVEARKDQSTRVAVLSGEVKVGPDQSATHLRKGEAAEVRTHGVTLLSPEEVKEMLQNFDQEVEVPGSEFNWLKNGSFDKPNEGEWKKVGKHVSIENETLRVSSGPEMPWPNARQNIWGDDLSGRVYAASVRAMQPADDPLQSLQFAVLKVNFINQHRKVFAYASKYFQFGGEEVDVFKTAEVAAIAPAGTKGVSLELLINARGQYSGTVIFDDAVLRVGEPPATNASNN